MKGKMKLISLLFVFALVLGCMVAAPASVSAATDVTKTVSYSKRDVYVYGTTAKKRYWWSSTPTTTYTFRNYSRSGNVAIYKYVKTSSWGWTGPVYLGNLRYGQVKTTSVKANGVSVKFLIQRTNNASSTVSVHASGGSIW